MANFQTHDLLNCSRIAHGFFTRKGGVSSPPYDSLNVGQGSRDDPAHVAENRKRVASALGAKETHLLSLGQIHSRDVLIVDRPFRDAPPQADGLVTKVPGLAISALAADCGPVLLADTNAGVIGACHAGWRGSLSGITDSTIDAMENLGAARLNIHAVLGPCISAAAYEVGPEFRDTFCAEDETFDRFFNMGDSGRAHFDLKAFILMRLRRAGLTRIDAIKDCTYGMPESYFSYRYNTHKGVADYGRNISAIMLR